METDQAVPTLANAKQEFLSLLSRLSPGDGKDFLDWILDQHSSLFTDENTVSVSSEENDDALRLAVQASYQAELMLQPIQEDLRRLLPFSGVCSSETVIKPEIGKNSDCDPATTAVIDSFLYDLEEVYRLCDQNLFRRSYCRQCGSQDTAPLTFISHSMSVLQMKYIFNVLPKLRDISHATMVDVGSRLGAVLYGAYYFSKLTRIIGIEMNQELCQLQNEIILKYSLGDRIEVICNDVCNAGNLLRQADVILLNNTFEFFLSREVQIDTWKYIQQNVTKSGCVLITVPSLEESLCIGDNGQSILDIESWVRPLLQNQVPNVPASELDYPEEDIEELSQVHFYQVQ